MTVADPRERVAHGRGSPRVEPHRRATSGAGTASTTRPPRPPVGRAHDDAVAAPLDAGRRARGAPGRRAPPRGRARGPGCRRRCRGRRVVERGDARELLRRDVGGRRAPPRPRRVRGSPRAPRPASSSASSSAAADRPHARPASARAIAPPPPAARPRHRLAAARLAPAVRHALLPQARARAARAVCSTTRVAGQDELRAHLHRGAAGQLPRPHAAADPVAGLEHDDVAARAQQRVRRRQPRQAGADHRDRREVTPAPSGSAWVLPGHRDAGERRERCGVSRSSSGSANR